MTFAEKIKYVRETQYLSQEMLAAQLGIAFATVNRWETGKCEPSWKMQRIFRNYCEQHNIVFEE
ncbi:MAG: helix-turn-helix transcriptional regulator [Clostridia bacterium]